MQYGKEAAEDSMSEEGTVRALGRDRLRATSVRPGMTGTGAPVTEQIRCCRFSEAGWYRVPTPLRIWAAFLIEN